jgi:hypothetical protein
VAEHVERLLPVLIGHDYEHVMGRAVIDREPNKVIITITSEGPDGHILGEFLTAAEPIALSFTGIPVKPRTTKSKENI